MTNDVLKWGDTLLCSFVLMYIRKTTITMTIKSNTAHTDTSSISEGDLSSSLHICLSSSSMTPAEQTQCEDKCNSCVLITLVLSPFETCQQLIQRLWGTWEEKKPTKLIFFVFVDIFFLSHHTELNVPQLHRKGVWKHKNQRWDHLMMLYSFMT